MDARQPLACTTRTTDGGTSIIVLEDPARSPFKTSAHLSVAVVTRFGGGHLALTDPDGTSRALPPGLAHYLEHLLIRSGLDTIIRPFMHQYDFEINAVVHEDRTVWYIRNLWLQRQRVTSVAREVVTMLLSLVLTAELDYSLRSARESWTRDLLAWTSNDIINEMVYRWSQDGYRLQVALRSALYPGSPLGLDMLGTGESVRSITREDVEAARAMLRRRVDGVIVIWRDTTPGATRAIVDVVERALDGFRNDGPDPPPDAG